MEDVQQSIQKRSFDKSPAGEIFSTSVEAWKKNLDAFAELAKPQPEQYAEGPQPAAPENGAAAQAPLAGENIFRLAVQEQMELCRFLAKRWEQYLSLPADISRCHSPGDLAQLQLSFMTRMAADYGIEGRHFAQAFQDLVSEAMRFNPTPFFTKLLPHN